MIIKSMVGISAGCSMAVCGHASHGGKRGSGDSKAFPESKDWA